MAEKKFDLYYKWLGIPSAEQPPNKYRLLGISKFESDSEVIEAAAQRQLSHVRTYALGPHAEASQRLLSELVSARKTLLDSQLKSEYDRELRLSVYRDEGFQPNVGMTGKAARSENADQGRRWNRLSVLAAFASVVSVAFGVWLLSLVIIFAGGMKGKVADRAALANTPQPLPRTRTEFLEDPTQTSGEPTQTSGEPTQTSGEPTQTSGEPSQVMPVSERSEVVLPDSQLSEANEASSSELELVEMDAQPVQQSQVGTAAGKSDSSAGESRFGEAFDIRSASSDRRAWAERLGVAFESLNSIGMEFKRIPADAFTRKDGDDSWRVWLTKSYEIGIYEVTQAQYIQVMGVNPSGFDGERNPVDQVSWVDANEFCRRLSDFPEEKMARVRYRLPTEAEWEHACRAGTETRYSFGKSDSLAYRYGWSKTNSRQQTHEVGEKRPNPWGLYDMHGNVWEWCQDWYQEYSRTDVTDPVGPDSGTLRVVRGGSWFNPVGFMQSASRGRSTPNRRINNHGFRVVREGVEEPAR